MNLDTCTPDQRLSIEYVNGPLLVSAGAGSGKTFTLTQRIAYALLPESGPAVGDIDEILAITFTEKAAAEIKARVKRTLRAEGMIEEALKVDGAWISTIHGMCARILRTHALDLGIDPAFGILGEAERAEMLETSVDEAIGADNDIIDRGSYARLFDEYPARSAISTAPSVASFLGKLLDKASSVRGGLGSIVLGPEPAHAGTLARDLLSAYERVLPALEQAGGSAAAEKARSDAASAMESLESYLADHPEGNDLAMREFARVMNGCAFIPKTFGGAAVKEEVDGFQRSYGFDATEALLALAYPRACELMTLAGEVSKRFEAKKRAARLLDNDDLLVCTLAAFEDHPDISRRYGERFKLVMVDEFQDTSQLQIDMITRLAGRNCGRLCTVGDAQQSIYRFRGADVNVYEAHKRTMRSEDVDARYVELRQNFRSHGDVLSFVDRVFGQPGVFGRRFMSLVPDPNRPSRWKGGTPRIDLVLALRPSGRSAGVSTDDVKRAGARAVAERFAALREEGHAPGEMVVLLGRMTRAGMYADALRERGFECVVAGGSQFAAAPEVHVVVRLAEAVANPSNTAALFEVLASDMLRLSADDLLELSTERDETTGSLRRRDLDRGFARLTTRTDLPDRLAHAVRVVMDAQEALTTAPLSRVVLDALVASGWMARLDAQGASGLACAGNILKAVRSLEALESEHHLGPASAARLFSSEIAGGMKEAPGALSGRGGDVVRIMTIHASKGLEFPIVAVADFSGSATSEKLVIENVDGAVFTSLAPSRSEGHFPQLKRRRALYAPDEEDPDLVSARGFIDGGARRGRASCTQSAYRYALEHRAADESLSEDRRKLYVALTRASEALVIAMDAKEPATGKPFAYPSLIDDIRGALCGADDFPEGQAFLPYGGSEPARFERVIVRASGDTGDEPPSDAREGETPSRFFVPRVGRPAARVPWNQLRDKVFSYSSIAPRKEGGGMESDSGDHAASVSRDARVPEGDPSPSSNGDRATTRRASDADRATGLGSAFHRAAQFAVETGLPPDAARLAVFSRVHGLSPEQERRLDEACARWFSSTTYAETRGFSLLRAEVPFCLPLDGDLMEGEIDLLCTNGPEGSGGPALVVDYKTGGTDEETAAVLHAKHLLQAQCYAYAVLLQGYGEVELRFVRVERTTAEARGGGDPQEVRYRFVPADLGDLRAAITHAYHQALR